MPLGVLAGFGGVRSQIPYWAVLGLKAYELWQGSGSPCCASSQPDYTPVVSELALYRKDLEQAPTCPVSPGVELVRTKRAAISFVASCVWPFVFFEKFTGYSNKHFPVAS